MGEKEVSGKTEEEGWDHKVCLEIEIMYYLWWKQEKTSDLCTSDFALHFVWTYPVPNLKLDLTAQPHSVCWLGTTRTFIYPTVIYKDALTQLSLPASLSQKANRM